MLQYYKLYASVILTYTVTLLHSRILSDIVRFCEFFMTMLKFSNYGFTNYVFTLHCCMF